MKAIDKINSKKKTKVAAPSFVTAIVEPGDGCDNAVKTIAGQAEISVEAPGGVTEQQTQNSCDSLRSVLLAYYSLIDSEAIDEVLSLFSQNATYLRCEALYEGIAEIERFYRYDRKIRGIHDIKNLWIIERTGIVEGTFSGRGAEDQPKHVGFADIFTFNQEGKISDRHTYLQLQSDYVKE